LLRVRDASERLETLYARLRRCRHLCSGKPLIEKHTIDGRHDCGVVKCQVHVCKPYAASSIRQIHASSAVGSADQAAAKTIGSRMPPLIMGDAAS